MTKEEAGHQPLDVILVTGDAYVDHPSWGVAAIGRWLEAHGFSVGVIAQPDWENPDAFRYWENHAYFLASPLEIWTRWSISIPHRVDCGLRIPTAPVDKLVPVRIEQPLRTPLE